MTEALASRISGARCSFDGIFEGDLGDGGGRATGDSVEDGGEEEEEEEEDDDDGKIGDAGSSGYKDARSSIAIFWKSPSRDVRVPDGVPIRASSIGSNDSSVAATV